MLGEHLNQALALTSAEAVDAAARDDVEAAHDFACASLCHAGKARKELSDMKALGARVIERSSERDTTRLQIAAKLGTRSPRRLCTLKVGPSLLGRQCGESVHLSFPFSCLVCLSESQNRKLCHALCKMIRMRGAPRAKMTWLRTLILSPFVIRSISSLPRRRTWLRSRMP